MSVGEPNSSAWMIADGLSPCMAKLFLTLIAIAVAVLIATFVYLTFTLQAASAVPLLSAIIRAAY